MKIRCMLFGHRPEGPGWWGDIPYMKLRSTGADNLGRLHGAAYHECRRCGEEYMVGRLHFTDPVIRDALKRAEQRNPRSSPDAFIDAAARAALKGTPYEQGGTE